MGAIEWDTSLETGDETVDRPLRTLIGLFNELSARAGDVAPAEALAEMLGAFVHYADEHFRVQQEMMARAALPYEELVAHLAEHETLARHARVLVHMHSSGELTNLVPLGTLIEGALTPHVLRMDRLLVANVQAKLAYA